MNNNYRNNSPVNPNYHIANYNINNLYRSNPLIKREKKKLNFKEMKNNTICSLNEVEHFLNNFQHTLRYIKLFKLLK